ncbi:transporter [Blastopirellula sp. J2-11]|uniref:transporter n=1 Tax=Blastopirellula sp. J2-11 TaxID=2943192 RepID=UPI0021CA6D8D|nr:transporter [Blastopirellula sp. J2-11]UUO07580.1 transporter [Blastopirellula sp. J2-11]
MMTRTFLFLCVLGVAGDPAVAVAQLPLQSVAERAFSRRDEGEEEDEIETDRDSFTPATSVVGYHQTVIESAYTFIDNRGVPETHSFPELVARIGLSDTIELRLGWNYEIGGAGNPVSGNVPDNDEEEAGIERESSLLYGGKFLLTEQCGWTPRSSLIMQGYTPTSGEANDSSFSTSYVSGWQFWDGWEWDSALRYSTSSLEEDHFNAWAPSTVLKVPVGERWKAHAEYFGIFTDGREAESVQHFFSPGLHYLVTPNLEVGVRVGWGLNDQSPNFFSNVGGGVRF